MGMIYTDYFGIRLEIGSSGRVEDCHFWGVVLGTVLSQVMKGSGRPPEGTPFRAVGASGRPPWLAET